MVVEWFIGVVGTVLGFIADLLPEWDLPAFATGALGFALTLDGVLPVSESLAVVSIALVVLTLLTIWRVFRIIVSHVPLFGGSG